MRHGVTYGQVGMGVGHGGLLVQRYGVVHGGGDASNFELLLHGVAAVHLDGVLGPGAGRAGRGRRAEGEVRAAGAGAGVDATRGVRAADIAVAVAGVVGANAMLPNF